MVFSIVCHLALGLLKVYLFDNGSGSIGWLSDVNGDRGFNIGDANSDSGVHNCKDKELDSDDNSARNGVIMKIRKYRIW